MPFDNPIDKLIAGNRRFSKNNLSHTNQDTKRRNELTSGQNPFAAFVCCSDSRVPPEIIFDCGLGDLFITRIAGNITTREILGSLESSGSIALNFEDFALVGNRKSYSFNLEFDDGVVSNNINDSAVKRDLATELSKSSSVKSILKTGHFRFQMDNNFIFYYILKYKEFLIGFVISFIFS